MQKLLSRLKADFPTLIFLAGRTSSWSPTDHTVTYSLDKKARPEWSLLHETSHAILKHANYGSDFELVALEAAAWQKAEELATVYGYAIDPDHVQDCLDTYRDWLHRRCTCPVCGNKSLQENPSTYACFNCNCKWHVSASRFCRPYRMQTSANPKSESRNPKQIPSFQ